MKSFLAIYKKDLRGMFMGATAYFLIAAFLIINGLFLWVFKSPYNILDNGYSDLSDFFRAAPWLMMILTSVLTMRSFSEEFKTGTIEILFTKPITTNTLVLGKFFAILSVLFVAVIPTFTYVISIFNLSEIPKNVGLGIFVTSYLGLFLVITLFCAIGITCSAFTKNQIVAFLSSSLLIFLFYYGFSQLNTNYIGSIDFKQIASTYHYDNFRKGLIDSRSLVYFISISISFLFITQHKIKTIKK